MFSKYFLLRVAKGREFVVKSEPNNPLFYRRRKISKLLWEKEKNAAYQHFILFSQCFSNLSVTKLIICAASDAFNSYCLKFCYVESFNPFPNKPWLLRVCSTSLLKTMWEKENLLVTSNFSFFHIVFYPFGEQCFWSFWRTFCPFGELSAIFIKFNIVVCKHFQFGRVRNLSFGKGLIWK